MVEHVATYTATDVTMVSVVNVRGEKHRQKWKKSHLRATKDRAQESKTNIVFHPRSGTFGWLKHVNFKNFMIIALTVK